MASSLALCLHTFPWDLLTRVLDWWVRERVCLVRVVASARCTSACLTVTTSHSCTAPRQVWFIEKCRHLEVEKLGLVTRMHDMEVEGEKKDAQRQKIATANKSLKLLVSDLTDRLHEASAESRELHEQVGVRTLVLLLMDAHRTA